MGMHPVCIHCQKKAVILSPNCPVSRDCTEILYSDLVGIQQRHSAQILFLWFCRDHKWGQVMHRDFIQISSRDPKQLSSRTNAFQRSEHISDKDIAETLVKSFWKSATKSSHLKELVNAQALDRSCRELSLESWRDLLGDIFYKDLTESLQSRDLVDGSGRAPEKSFKQLE